MYEFRPTEAFRAGLNNLAITERVTTWMAKGFGLAMLVIAAEGVDTAIHEGNSTGGAFLTGAGLAGAAYMYSLTVEQET